MAGDNPGPVRPRSYRTLPQDRILGRGPNRGIELPDTLEGLMVHPITGPEPSIPGGPMQSIGKRRQLASLEEQAFLKNGSKEFGTRTARQTGARALAIRHFEELAKGARDIADYRRKKATI